jgi:hypothetical protein
MLVSTAATRARSPLDCTRRAPLDRGLALSLHHRHRKARTEVPRTTGPSGCQGGANPRRRRQLKPSTNPAVLAPNSRQSDRGSCGFERFQAAIHRERSRCPIPQPCRKRLNQAKERRPAKGAEKPAARISRPLTFGPVEQKIDCMRHNSCHSLPGVLLRTSPPLSGR